MAYELDRIKDGDKLAVILADDDPMSPREWGNVGVMVCWHRRYNLGDEQPKCSPAEYLADMLADAGLADDQDADALMAKLETAGYVFLPLYLYDHSGITMSTHAFSCPWDSGQVGFIYATPEAIQAEWKGDQERAREYLRGEVEAYDQFLTGDVWRVEVRKLADGEDEDGEYDVIDSCGGFFGSDYAREEARGMLGAAS